MANFSRHRLTLACFLLLSVCLQAQSGRDFSETLKPNVVRVKGIETGFGFIIGENSGTIYLATAAHVLYGDNFDQSPSQIKVFFFNDATAQIARDIKTFDQDLDVAVLQIPKPANLKWRSDCADIKPDETQTVRYIGKNEKWVIPNDGKITEVHPGTIHFDIGTIEEGTSGAPLLSDCGIIGLITKSGDHQATRIESIKSFLKNRGLPSYFGLSAHACATSSSQPCTFAGGSKTVALCFDQGSAKVKGTFKREKNCGFSWYSGSDLKTSDSWTSQLIDVPKCAQTIVFSYNGGKIESSNMDRKEGHGTVLRFQLFLDEQLVKSIDFLWEVYGNVGYPANRYQISIPQDMRDKKLKVVVLLRDAWDSNRIGISVMGLKVEMTAP